MSEYFSHSKLDSYDTCPRQYKFRYIEKAKVEKEVTIEVFTGQLLHRCLQKLYDAKRMGKVFSLEEILAIHDSEWDSAPVKTLKVNNPNLSVQDYIDDSRRSLAKYYESHQPFDDGETLAVEEKISMTLDEERGFKLRGVIDRLRRNPDGSLEIIDYKYKKGLPKQSDLEQDQQLALYTLAARENWPNLGAVSARLVYLKQDLEFPVTISEDMLDVVRAETIARILQIKAAERLDDFPTKESRLCDWCAYLSLCPAKRHAVALEDEMTADEEAAHAQELAELFLEVKRKADTYKSELDAIKAELADLAQKLELDAFEGKTGRVKITQRDVEAFPSRTQDASTVANITEAVKMSDPMLFEMYAELKLNDLYKAYLKEQLPDDLREKLSNYLIKKRQLVARASFFDPDK